MKSSDQAEETPLLPEPPFTPNALASTHTGYLLIFIASLCFPVVALLVRYSETEYSYPVISALILRAIISIVLALPFVPCLQPSALHLSRIQAIQLISSAIFGAGHFVVMYTALKFSPLATYVTIQSTTTPLTAFFCAIFLGEGVRRSEIFALVSSTLGVVLIAHPGKDDFKSIHGIALSISTAFLAAFWCMLLRAMGEVHVLFRVFSLCVFIGLESAYLSTSSDWLAIIENHTGTMLTSIAAALSFFTMIAFNTGMKICRAGPGLLVMTISVPHSFGLGWLFLGETVGWHTLLGSALVIGGAGVVALQAIQDGRR